VKAAAATTDRRLLEALVALERFTDVLTDVADRTVGMDSSGNREVAVLLHLHLVGPMRPVDVVEVTGLSRPAAATLISRLEAERFVRRRPMQDDRRKVLVSLTPSGRRRVQELERALAACFAEEAGQIRTLVELLDGRVVDPAPAPTDRALAIVAQMAAVGTAWTAERERRLGALPNKVRFALGSLALEGPMRAGDLGAVVGLSSGGLTYFVDHLVDAGLVDRQYGRVEHDRRAVLIDVTPAGRRVVDELCSSLDDYSHPFADAIAATIGSGADP
jgi:MarR family transcriptional regulator, lower aerobic nicotinate degradation pathway regulator